MSTKHTISMITLGCSKNLVDAECMSAILREQGYEMVEDVSSAEAVVVNTCGFIESAKKEAIDTILEVASLKGPRKKLKFIVATGCLAQRYPEEIKKSLPEVDAVLGTSHYQDIAAVLDKLFGKEAFGWNDYIGKPGSLKHMRRDRDQALCLAEDRGRLLKWLCFLCDTRYSRQIYFPSDGRHPGRSGDPRKERI